MGGVNFMSCQTHNETNVLDYTAQAVDAFNVLHSLRESG